MNTQPEKLPSKILSNGDLLARHRPVFVDISSKALAHPQPQYVVATTLLGDQVLCWLEPWMAGLFSLIEIMDFLPSYMWHDAILSRNDVPAKDYPLALAHESRIA